MITDVMYESKSMQISKLQLLPTENSNRKLLFAAHDLGKKGEGNRLGAFEHFDYPDIFISCLKNHKR